MLHFTKKLILSMLVILPMQSVAQTNLAMQPIISYLLSDSSETPQKTYTDPTVQTGKFIDSPVMGLGYRCSGDGGIIHQTNIDGEYTCKKGARLKFFIGRINLGHTTGGWISFNHSVSPKTLYPIKAEAVRIAQILQTLDKDANPENGIEINNDIAKYLSHEYVNLADDNFEANFEASINQTNKSLGNENSDIKVVSYEDAQRHLDFHASDEKMQAIRKALKENHIAPSTFTTSAGTYTIPTISRETQLKFVDAVNKVRLQDQNCGVHGTIKATSLISWNTKLHNAAYSYNWDMAYAHARTHIGSGTDNDVVATALQLDDGSTAAQRISYFGYEYTRMGENVARGYPTVEQALEGLLSSDDHCKLLMSPKYPEMGLSHMIWTDNDGKTHHYWTQDFGAPRDFENPAPSYPAKVEPKIDDGYHITVYGSLRCPRTKALTEELNTKNIPYLFRDVYNYNEDRVDPKRVIMIGTTPAYTEVNEIDLTIDVSNDGKIMLPVAVVKKDENVISTDAADINFIEQEIK